MGRVLRIGTAAVVLGLALTGAACSSSSGAGSSPSSASASSPAAGGATATLHIKDFAFEPSTLPVGSGPTTISITNTGSVAHSFTLNDGSVDQVVQPGQTVSVTVDLTADAPFHCKFHAQMTGTLKVG
jgi:plastocyanin